MIRLAAFLMLSLLLPAVADAQDERRPAVVLELFTSQGCSSCPPADRLLSRLGEEAELAGARLVPLSFHVDYWDYIGWRDPFSAAEWTERQRAYARGPFRTTRIYTPQLVIDGRFECVGADEREVRRLVREAAEGPRPAEVRLELSGAVSGETEATVAVHLARDTGHDRLQLFLVIWESGFSTEVGRGENARRRLRNDHVVRRLVRGFEIDGSEPAELERSIALELDPGWQPRNLGVAALLQDPETRQIVAADSSPLGP